MCFSATASFVVAGLTGAAGFAGLAMAPSRRYALFASIPLGFAFQQTVEGMIWRRLEAGVPGQSLEILSNAFLLIGEATWPLIIPLAIWLIEPDATRRRWIGWLTLLGAALFCLFSLLILSADYTVWIDERSLHYDGSIRVPDEMVFYPFQAGDAWHLAGLDWTVVPYAIATLGALILSSHFLVRIFGYLAVIGLVASIALHRNALVSVWCFFTAIISMIVLLQIRVFVRSVERVDTVVKVDS